MKFREKTIVEAIQWDGTDSQELQVYDFTGGKSYRLSPTFGTIYIRTLGGDMTANAGYWIVKDSDGESRPVSPKVFAATYEPVAD